MTLPSAISSPCINICVMDRGLCIGCARTIDEIGRWGSLAEADRLAIIELLPQRLAEMDADHQNVVPRG